MQLRFASSQQNYSDLEMFLSRVGTRVVAGNHASKIAPAMGIMASEKKFAPMAAASPLFFTEFKDATPLSETVFYWPGNILEEQFQKNIEPNADIALLAVGAVTAWRLAVHFGITLNTFVREAQVGYAVRWQPGHHKVGPWEAVDHPLITKK